MTLLRSINPSNGQLLGEVPATPLGAIPAMVKRAKKAQNEWYNKGLSYRLACLERLADLMEKNKESLSRLTAQEMGRPYPSCLDLADYAIAQFRWNLKHASSFLSNEITYEDDATIHEVIYEPWGVVACIMAWNFPIGNFAFSVTQALIAGNSVIVKYSEEIPIFSKTLEGFCALADLPDGVLSFVHGGKESGAMLTDQPIDLISFTGSSATGRALRVKAAEKGIPVVLEMGGSSPGIVFADADKTDLWQQIFDFRFANTGQFCDNLKRLIVHRSLFDESVETLASLARQARLGDPFDAQTDLGPLVAERQVVVLEEQVQDALAKGATLVCGGKRPADLVGAWYEPTLLTNITRDMRVWSEEVFGPVLPIVPFDAYDEALALANDTSYGLTAYAFTAHPETAQRVLGDLQAGCVSLNGADYFRPENPFGGYKNSGSGRENGKWGFHDVCQVKLCARPKSRAK
ncbi:MAG: aldehyde dehydrogenase [Bdellovibrionales bacterium]